MKNMRYKERETEIKKKKIGNREKKRRKQDTNKEI